MESSFRNLEMSGPDDIVLLVVPDSTRFASETIGAGGGCDVEDATDLGEGASKPSFSSRRSGSSPAWHIFALTASLGAPMDSSLRNLDTSVPVTGGAAAVTSSLGCSSRLGTYTVSDGFSIAGRSGINDNDGSAEAPPPPPGRVSPPSAIVGSGGEANEEKLCRLASFRTLAVAIGVEAGVTPRPGPFLKLWKNGSVSFGTADFLLPSSSLSTIGDPQLPPLGSLDDTQS